jgi:hypothetical protein
MVTDFLFSEWMPARKMEERRTAANQQTAADEEFRKEHQQ